ncbi:AAEL006626-PA [Aedes aegypti]|uniref:AAEL006626-PA n=1 Tax=Aedes aegypti TaxID=7159 RepID=Q175M6_AEDAE|nr:AAEL006626-PA [Aedes aegypti]
MSANMAFTIEPYRRGASFTDWFTRLKYFFKVNNVKEEDKMAYFVTLSGPSMFAEIKLLYPAGNFEEVAFEDLIAKLKSRLDKIEPDLVQRYKFSSRVQNPGETTEDFVLALKLQAEFCGFDNYKEIAILDRLIVGINDKNLRQRLLGEEKLSLANAEKIIATWEIAKANAGAVDEGPNGNTGFVAAIRNGSERVGIAYGKLNRTFDLAKRYQEEEALRGTGSGRGPVKSRLGMRSYDEGHHSRARCTTTG